MASIAIHTAGIKENAERWPKIIPNIQQKIKGFSTYEVKYNPIAERADEEIKRVLIGRIFAKGGTRRMLVVSDIYDIKDICTMYDDITVESNE